MPVRRLLAVGLWLLVTASATAIVWAGTSTVAADLTDRPAPVVAPGDVVTALESGASDAETAPGITAPGATTTSTVPSGGPRPAPGGQVRGPSGPGAPVPGVATTIPPAPPPAPAPPPPPAPGRPPTTQPPARPTASYSTPGGVATVACNGYFIQLLSATPRNGYAARVVTAGPYYVEVHFVGPDGDEPVWAFCLGQPIRVYDGASRPWDGPRRS